MNEERRTKNQELSVPLLCLTGPTASGKTAIAVGLARLLEAEIISMDSMALYRGMDIGTAKPTASERASARHHLIDVIEPHQGYSVAQYLDAARIAATEIGARNREVLFVGGTPLYLKSLLRGIFSGPPADWALRRRLEAYAQVAGQEALHARLAAVDAASAKRLHPRDTRRLIRAIEVYEKLGRPISELQRQFDQPRAADTCRVVVLDWPRDMLLARIDAHVEAMFAAGLVEEVRQLTSKRQPLSRTAGQAVGYREVTEHLRGERGLPETIALVKTRTRQFAKRQLTWFRSLPECRSVPVREPLDPAEVASTIAALMEVG